MQVITRSIASISLIVMMLAALFHTFGVMGLIGYLATGTWLTLAKLTDIRRAKHDEAMRSGILWKESK